MNCNCGSEKEFDQCCGRFLSGEEQASTPEELMRSRYTAYCRRDMEYLYETTDPQARNEMDWEANQKWAEEAEFLRLEILGTEMQDNKGWVDFSATFRRGGEEHVHREHSLFRKRGGEWFFREGRELKKS